MPSAASSVARVTAMVVRPGAPVGPQTATTRPDPASTRSDGPSGSAMESARESATASRPFDEAAASCIPESSSGRRRLPPAVELAVEGVQGRVGGHRLLGERRLELGELRVAGHHAGDAELVQPALRLLVTVGRDPDHVHARRPELRDGREVEAAQVARDEGDRAEAGRRRRDEVGQVRAAADDAHLARGLQECRDPAVPAVAERREDMRHEVPWPGTGTRVNRDCLSTAAMISATLSRGTRSWTAIVDDAAPNRPESWVTGETLTRSRASVASR